MHRRSDVNTLLIDQPVRSGQSVVFERGDITVLGSVASGAEVMAGGSVHVYGTLRGRAIAGLRGQPARADFLPASCRPSYWRSTASTRPPTTCPPSCCGKPVQAWLDGEQMKISVLD